MGSTKRFSLAEKVEVGTFTADIKSFTKKGFWHIPEWQLGCTAIGSSGSPLFDADYRVIGALTGGSSYCNTPYNDFYYRVYSAWQPSDDVDRQLQYWLSPDNPNVKTCDGMNPYAGAAAVRLSHVVENNKQDHIETARLTENSYLFGLNETGTTEYAERYSLLSPAELYGCYLVTPAYSGRTAPQVEVRVYGGDDKPETLLAQKEFRPVYRVWEGDEAVDQTKPLYRSQEHFIAFDEPVRVQGNLFISYKIKGENDDRFCVYNVSKGEESAHMLGAGLFKVLGGLFQIVDCVHEHLQLFLAQGKRNALDNNTAQFSITAVNGVSEGYASLVFDCERGRNHGLFRPYDVHDAALAGNEHIRDAFADNIVREAEHFQEGLVAVQKHAFFGQQGNTCVQQIKEPKMQSLCKSFKIFTKLEGLMYHAKPPLLFRNSLKMWTKWREERGIGDYLQRSSGKEHGSFPVLHGMNTNPAKLTFVRSVANLAPERQDLPLRQSRADASE